MAPTITSAMTYSKEHLTHKLRKPLVEKLRRERINRSIEQIKSLLGPEIFNQQLDSKVEKADILEMTVSFLRRLKQQQYQPVSTSSCSTAANQGYSRCVKEMVNFLSKEDVTTQSRESLLSHFQSLQSLYDKDCIENCLPHLSSQTMSSNSEAKGSVVGAPWRPW